jgi:hypothetical protein
VPDASDVDIVVYQEKDHLIFQGGSRRILKIPIEQFFADPPKVLQRFSEACDRYALFRQFTFVFLLIGFPVSIYMMLHAALYYLGYTMLGSSRSALTASILCLLIGMAVLFYFQTHRSRSIPIQNISEALISDDWQTRVAAFKLIAQKELEIADYQTDALLLRRRPVQERYWLARTLGVSRRANTLGILLEFLHDDSLNVRTMAIYSLGLRSDPQAIGPLISKIEKTDSWYEQMYAYKSLRSLGWNQSQSH